MINTDMVIAPRRMQTYIGTTDAAGDFVIVFAPPFASTPVVDPVCCPPADATTRARVTVLSNTGFTVHTERNSGVNVLGIDVLLFTASVVPNVPIRVMVVES